MKKFLIILSLILMFCATCSAMTFSQPTYIGEAITRYQRAAYGLYIRDATYNNSSYYREFIKDNTFGYGKGTAIFDKDEDAICFYFDYHHGDKKSTFKFGSKNIKNTVDCLPGTIKKIKTDEGIVFYEIDYHVYRISVKTIIGRRKDGRWIKYIDTDKINKTYFGKNLHLDDCPIYHEIICKGDTVILPYSFIRKSSKGEFRFKWDDVAQWFGVEQVIY